MKTYSYQGKLSGPLLDRIDLHVEVGALAAEELLGAAPGESTASIRQRVVAARVGWSGRSIHRCLKVARTIADLAGAQSVQLTHVAEAVQYRRALKSAP